MAEKERKRVRPKQGKTGFTILMDFLAIPTAGEGARGHGKEGKEERKEEKGLPSTPTRLSGEKLGRAQ